MTGRTAPPLPRIPTTWIAQCLIQALVCAGVATSLASCIPLPYALPPLRGSVTTAVATGDIAPDQVAPEIAEDTDSSELALTGYIGLHPLQMARDQRWRDFDVGAGYVFELLLGAGDGAYAKQGAYLGASWHPWQSYSSARGRGARLGLHATGDLLVASHRSQVGGGGTIAISIEYLGFADSLVESSNSSGSMVGYFKGEGGIGAQLTLGYRAVGGARYGIIGLSAVFRLPGGFGIIFAPIQ